MSPPRPATAANAQNVPGRRATAHRSNRATSHRPCTYSSAITSSQMKNRQFKRLRKEGKKRTSMAPPAAVNQPATFPSGSPRENRVSDPSRTPTLLISKAATAPRASAKAIMSGKASKPSPRASHSHGARHKGTPSPQTWWTPPSDQHRSCGRCAGEALSFRRPCNRVSTCCRCGRLAEYHRPHAGSSPHAHGRPTP